MSSMSFFSPDAGKGMLLAALVGMLVAFFLAVAVSGQELPAIGVLRLYSGSGTIEVVSADKTVRKITEGELREMSLVVRKGETIRTGENSSAILLKDDHTGMLLGEDTILDTQADIKAGHSLSLLKGKLNVKVRPPDDKSPRREFLLKMPTTILAVKGTSFFAEVAGGQETGGVNEGKIEAVRLIDGQERKAAITAGNALVLKREGAGSFRRLSSEELGYQSIYESLEKDLDDKDKPTERGFVELCWIPVGKFEMGDAKVKVELTKGFWLGKYELTQGEYEEVMGTNPARFKEVGRTAPVERVSWQDAVDFCRKLTERGRASGSLPEGWVYRLPTEAQWEYACRAGTTGDYNVDGASLDELAWYKDNSGNKTHEVGQKKANAWGLRDMHGNVGEWCADWSANPLPGGKDPEGAENGAVRVCRGGSFNSSAAGCRSANRYARLPLNRYDYLGLRPALVPSRTGR